MSFYKEILMDHFKNPRNKGKLENPSFSTKEYNPSCGDSIAFDGIIENGLIKALSFDGKGCVISLATASIFTEYFIAKDIDEILKLGPGDIKTIIGMDVGPIRIKCAMLSLIALQEGISEYKNNLR